MSRKNCLDFKTIDLQEHQKIPSAFIINPLNRGLLLFYSMGSGKTITSISMIRCLLERYPNKRAIVLTPASLVTNYNNELTRLSQDIKHIEDKIKVHSYVKFINSLTEHSSAGNDVILVIDESQNFLAVSSIRYKKLFDYSKTAYKVILLSGTPIRNNVGEISNELSLLNGYKVSKALIEKINDIEDPVQRKINLGKFLGCKIAYYSKTQKNFPERIDHTVNLTMGREYYTKYYEIQQNIKNGLHGTFDTTNNLHAFLNGVRKASNVVVKSLGSPKINWTINKIKRNVEEGKKVMVYSNWLGAGVNLLEEELIKLNITYSLITGKLTQKQKEENIRKYNKGTNKVIIISSSGAEGLNLKATRTVIILERHWNNAKLEQVIGRAIRLNSHASLPEHERKVDIFNLILIKPFIRSIMDLRIGSADEILQQMSDRKDKKIQDFYNEVKALSIEKHKTCF